MESDGLFSLARARNCSGRHEAIPLCSCFGLGDLRRPGLLRIGARSAWVGSGSPDRVLACLPVRASWVQLARLPDQLRPPGVASAHDGLDQCGAVRAERVFVEPDRRRTRAFPWWGLLSVFNPGLIVALTLDTTEITLAAAMLLGLLLWLRHQRLAGVVIAAACFAKELGWALPVGIGLVEVADVARRWYPELCAAPLRRVAQTLAAVARGGGLSRKLALLMAGPLLLSIWFAYVDRDRAPRAEHLPSHPGAGAARHSPAPVARHRGLESAAGDGVRPRHAEVASRRVAAPLRAVASSVARLRGRCPAPCAVVPSAHSGGLQQRVFQADQAGELMVQDIARRFGFQYYDLMPAAGVAQAVVGDAFDSRLNASDGMFAMGMLPVALAVVGVFLIGLPHRSGFGRSPKRSSRSRRCRCCLCIRRPSAIRRICFARSRCRSYFLC